MRKIIQIVATEAYGVDMLYALCRDGSLWNLQNPHPGKAPENWERIPLVPQEPEAEQPQQPQSPVPTVEPFKVLPKSRPWIQGNGFDGLRIGQTRGEAEAFVAWINEKLGFHK